MLVHKDGQQYSVKKNHDKIREARLRWLGYVERNTGEDVVMRTGKSVDTERWGGQN